MSLSCCPQGSWGAPLGASASAKSLEGMKGKLRVIGPENNLEIYVTSPASETPQGKAVIVFPDVYSLTNRYFAICDQLADELNVHLIAADFFRGETKANHTHDFVDWLRRHPYDNDFSSGVSPRTYPVGKDIQSCLQFLSSTLNVQPSNVAAIGFCWGVWALTKACSEGVKFSCAVGFHPSIKIEEIAFGMDQLDLVKAAAQGTPLLYVAAGNDHNNLKPPDGDVAKVILSSAHRFRGVGEKDAPKCIEFADMIHGWVSRGDTSDEQVKRDAEKALEMASKFLHDWM